ncbi:MAG: hypothetical protein KBH11_01110 [Bacteroidia bacterium]|nr:hypothetical protein [Bacteroidota bacterium]MBK8874823.1 hypothetical protein [Bacteroidota bacterium]MBK9425678.1 hypothetical protein [Bacteroidota bacterium]MBP9081645.1 hypothetical protein [Bacteroidia bacterium]
MKVEVSITRNTTLVILFSLAMGFLESAVVVYLREHYYPLGFQFPLVPVSLTTSITEIGREAATVIMLVCIGWLAGFNATTRFAYFILSFAVWDIMYYIGLKLVLNWPVSILEWDILFLIPFPWLGPVLAPCLLSVLMIILALFLLKNNVQKLTLLLPAYSWLLLTAGSLICIGSFLYEYIIYRKMSYSPSVESGAESYIMDDLKTFIPGEFSWALFLSGFILLTIPVFNLIHKTYRTTKA